MLLSLKVSADVYAQQVSLTLKNASLKKAIAELRKQSQYDFIYDDQYVSKANPVTIQISKATMEEALKAIFQGQPFTYEIFNKSIIIQPKSVLTGNKPNSLRQSIIKGKVTDSIGNPLVGVTIEVKGSDIVSTTNRNGFYEIRNVPLEAVLTFRLLGYAPYETVANDREINVRLSLVYSELAEVPIVFNTGYQNIPKERATGSFVQIDNELLNRRVSTNLMDRLEGVTNGMLFHRTDNGEPALSIRGVSTIFANNAPLVVVDNFPFDGDLNTINPNDIESVTILKDAAAASIWGVRAGNGVIAVTTKKGKFNTPTKVDFNSNLSIGQKPNPFYSQLASPHTFIDVERDLFDLGFYQDDGLSAYTPVVNTLWAASSGTIDMEQADDIINSYRNHDIRSDLLRHFYRNDVSQQYALNLNGGAEKTHYYFSAGLDDNQRNLIGNSGKRYSLRSTFQYNPLNNLEVTGDIVYTGSTSSNSSPLDFGRLFSVTAPTVTNIYPYARLADEQGNALPVNLGYQQSVIEEAAAIGLLDWSNRPLANLNNYTNVSEQTHIRLNTGIKYNVISGFNVELRYQHEKGLTSAKYNFGKEHYFTRDLVNSYTQVNSNGTISRPIPLGDIQNRTMSDLRSNQFRVQGNFNKTWGKHDLSALAGIEVKETSTDGYEYRVYGYDNNLITNIPVDYTSFYVRYPQGNSSTIPYFNTETGLLDRFGSIFSNASYNYDGKYTLSGSMRFDRSNYFGVRTNQQIVPLYSVGLKWGASKENFFDASWIDMLDIRATYGYNGNIDKSVTARTTTNSIISSLNGLRSSTIMNPPNPNLRWERIGVINIGADFVFKNDALSGSIEYFWKDGRDLIGFIPVAASSGVLRYKGNVANMSGQGLDLEIQSRIINGSFKWYTTFLFSHVTDKVKSYQDRSSNVSIASMGESSVIPVDGRPVYHVHSFRFAGLNPENGNPRAYAANGEISEDYAAIVNDEASLVYNGSARPTYFGAFRNTFMYKGFSVSCNIAYKMGYQFRRNSVNYSNLLSSNTIHEDVEFRWRQPGDELITNVPSLILQPSTNREYIYQLSDVLIESGSHIRLQDISISYDLINVRKKGFPLERIRIYGYINNVGLLWRENNALIDPDFIPSAVTYTYKAPLVFSLGTNFTF